MSSAILRHIGLTAGKGQCAPSHSSGSQTSETTTEQMIPCWRMSHYKSDPYVASPWSLSFSLPSNALSVHTHIMLLF